MTPKIIVIHHTASLRDKTSLNDINEWHRVRFNFQSSLGYFVGYHYVITADGAITQTRRDEEIGAHTIPNEGKIGVCLTGSFEFENPTPSQLNSLEAVIKKLKLKYNLTDGQIYGHLNFSATVCPGKKLYDWLLAYKKVNWLSRTLEELRRKLADLLAARR